MRVARHPFFLVLSAVFLIPSVALQSALPTAPSPQGDPQAVSVIQNSLLAMGAASSAEGGELMEARFRNNRKITTKDLEREVKFLKSTGKMPTLDQVLAAMAQARKEYRRRGDRREGTQKVFEEEAVKLMKSL